MLQLRSAVRINSIETLKSNGGKPRNLRFSLRSGPSFFYLTVDTGSPVSFLNKRTCDILLQRNPSIKFPDIARHHIDTLNFNDNKCPMRLCGLVRILISSNGWKLEDADFLISENRTRNLLCLDLHEKLGAVTNQLKAEPVPLLEDVSKYPISENWRSYFV